MTDELPDELFHEVPPELLHQLPEEPTPPEEEPAPAARWRLRWGLGAVAFLLVGWVVWEVASWPDVAALARKNPGTTAFIERYRARQRAAGESDAVRWDWVAYSRISPHLKRAVLVSEDIDFFSHRGFDWGEIEAALEEAWRRRELPRGASTLTQQLAKNLWLSPSYNPLRKVKEAVLTWELEHHLTKRRILELYLNVAELGPGIYGAEAAARHYFGVSAADLTPTQAAELAASLPDPVRWHPGSPSRIYHRRVATVLRRMAKARFLWRQI